MKRNTGRPPVDPTGPTSSLTMKIPSDLKRTIIEQANGYGMTITEYLTMLVERDGGRG